MGVFRGLHYVGTVLLFAAVGLLIVASVTAPVVNDLGLFRVNLDDDNNLGSSITFGTFGWCVRNYLGGDDRCSNVNVGYRPADIISEIDGSNFSGAREDTTRALSYVLVLHPVAAGLAFIAALFTFFEGTFGGIIATLASGIAFVVTAIVVICEFVLFALLRDEVNDGPSSLEYRPAIWCALIAAIWCLIGTVIAFLTCCSGRSKRRSAGRKGYSPATV